ncbi:hypothetical protein [Anaerosporobacter faecicola]|uniref:hypothetical protein n=1 Tax=Anaerosporobacter faecicola TaxID=2718714 RepID=UPI00143C883A|nr:hypothetical protein [Anaerosporobacter faecicola]
MAYKPHIKMQMQLVSSGIANMAYIEFDEKILLLDNVRGTFIKKDEVVVDLSKVRKIEDGVKVRGLDIVTLNPNAIMKNSVQGKITDHDEKGYSKVDCENGNYAWVSDYYKKIFGAKARFYVQGPTLPLLVTDGRKKQIGILLPTKVAK